MSTTYYTTEGSVRGGCGHAHTTYDAASACAGIDHYHCGMRGGYSDRVVTAAGTTDTVQTSEEDRVLLAASAWRSGDGTMREVCEDYSVRWDEVIQRA